MIRKTYASLILIIILGISCVPQDPVIPNEEELITTLKLTLKPMYGGEEVVLSFLDIDGDGGTQPQTDGGSLQANTTYIGIISLSNETTAPITDITQEVKNEGLDHQFFYVTSNGINLNINYDDTDSEGNPIGIKTVLMTGSNSNGQLTITLKHEPNKTATGVSDGDISNAGGETDIEVTFDVEVK
jgi:hypothetical protein